MRKEREEQKHRKSNKIPLTWIPNSSLFNNTSDHVDKIENSKPMIRLRSSSRPLVRLQTQSAINTNFQENRVIATNNPTNQSSQQNINKVRHRIDLLLGNTFSQNFVTISSEDFPKRTESIEKFEARFTDQRKFQRVLQ